MALIHPDIGTAHADRAGEQYNNFIAAFAQLCNQLNRYSLPQSGEAVIGR